MTTAQRLYQKDYRAKQRAEWKRRGVCLDCGKPRQAGARRCTWCLTGLSQRVDKCRFRRREGLA